MLRAPANTLIALSSGLRRYCTKLVHVADVYHMCRDLEPRSLRLSLHACIGSSLELFE